ncbi:unnamed protein product [Ixodes persulcatus]
MSKCLLFLALPTGDLSEASAINTQTKTLQTRTLAY